MSGWMVAQAVSQEPEIVKAVVPTVAIPLVGIVVALNALATAIARLFGVKLEWEGPKRLLEVFLKPKVIVSAIALNFAFVGAYYGYQYWKGLPVALWRVQQVNAKLALHSSTSISPLNYTNHVERESVWNPPALVQNPRISAADGKLGVTWHTQLKKGVFGGVSLSGNSLFVGSDDGYIYELSREEGRVLRQFFVGTEVTPQPLIYDNKLYAGEGIHDSHHSRIYSFDLKSGAFLGAFETKGHVEGQPVIATYQSTTLLFVMGGKDGIYAIDPNTLVPLWHHVGGHTDSEARFDGNRVYYSTGIEKGFKDKRQKAYALDFNSGKVIWEAKLTASGWMPAAILGNEVCFGLGEIYEQTNVGYLKCFDKLTGANGREIKFSSPVLGIPYFTGSTLAVSTLNGEVCDISWPDGKIRWCKQFEGKTYASVSYDGAGHLIYPSDKDGLIVLDEAQGDVIQKWNPPPPLKWSKVYASATIADDGWYLANMNGDVFKLCPGDQPGCSMGPATSIKRESTSDSGHSIAPVKQ